MKPVWEETWDTHPRGGGGHRLYTDMDEEEFASTWGSGPCDLARTRLASAAPEMARVLVAIETASLTCVLCKSSDRLVIGIPVHRSDCPLDAALKKAGVRE